MTLQQLRYFIAVAERGSFTATAHDLYTTQSNLSASVSDLERELGIEVFNRTSRGVTLTASGIELLGYARQVLEQVDMLEDRYAQGASRRARLAVSTQHYAFAVQAFLDIVDECAGQDFELTLRETTTRQVIDDVASFRSDVGLLYLSDFNERVISKALSDANLSFTLLYAAPVHVFMSKRHPLAGQAKVSLDDLEPYPCYSFDQGTTNSFYYSEEPLSHLPHRRRVAISDRAALTTLLVSTEGYTLSSGVLVPEMQPGVASIPVDTKESMRVGVVTNNGRVLDGLPEAYLSRLRQIVGA